MVIKLIPEDELAQLREASGKSDDDAMTYGAKEARRRGRLESYSNEEAIHLGWKYIRSDLKAKEREKAKKTQPVLSKTAILHWSEVPTAQDIKDHLFNLWLRDRITIKED